MLYLTRIEDINTGSVTVDNSRLRQIVGHRTLAFVGRMDGRYMLSFNLRKVDQDTTTVTVNSFIIVNMPAAGPLGGQRVPSNRTLEIAHLDAIAAKVSSAGDF